jgi:hypothetical protein
MNARTPTALPLSVELVQAIRAFPVQREAQHCGVAFAVDPFAFYADCPACRARIKVRSFSGCTEIEDVFDAVFEWMSRPGAKEAAQRRQKVLEEDRDE